MDLLKRLTRHSLSNNKKRTTVTIIGIMLSVALIVAMSGMVDCFRKGMIDYERMADGNYHYVYVGLDDDDVDVFKSNDNFEEVSFISYIGASKLDNSENENKPYIQLCGTDKKGFDMISTQLIEGRLPINSSEIVLPRHLKTSGRVEYNIGDEITLNLGTRKSETIQDMNYNLMLWDDEEFSVVETKKYKVVGFIERPIYKIEYYEAAGFTAFTYLEKPEKNVMAFVRYTKKALKDEYEITEGILGGNEELSADRNQWLISYERIWPADSTMLALYKITVVLAIIIVVTSVSCIKNSFSISVSERIRQYGMLASIGATRKQIKKSVFYEARILAIIGIPVGLMIGNIAYFVLIFVSNKLMGSLLSFKLTYSFSWISMVFAVMLGITTVYLSAMGSAIKASKVSPVTAIRNQNEIKLKSKKLHTPFWIKKIFGVGGVVSQKSIKRNKKKYRTSVVSILLCTATFIAISYFTSLMFDIIRLAYGSYDYNVVAKVETEKYDEDIVTKLSNMDYVKDSNIVLEGNVSISNCPETDETKLYKYNTTDDDVIKSMDDEPGRNVMTIIRMSGENYEKYAKSAGLSAEEARKGAILSNENTAYISINGEKKKKTSYDVYDYKAGDCIQGIVFSDADKAQYISLDIVAITSKRPFGYGEVQNYGILIIDESKWDELGMMDAWWGYNAFYDSDNPDKLQDALEKLVDTTEVIDSYGIENIDGEVKDVKALFLLVSIFAYGFIIVIALIGITNIINTLNTSMELRSGEFATLRSIGMTNKEFDRMIRLESLFIGGKSLVVGIPLGMALAYLINKAVNSTDGMVFLQFKMPIVAALGCIIVVFAILLLIMKLSMTKISKKNIIETIKNENV